MRSQNPSMGKAGFITRRPDCKLTAQPLCTTCQIKSTWPKHKQSHTVIPGPGILGDVIGNGELRPNTAWVIADDLHLLGVGVNCDLLQDESSGVLGQAVGGYQCGIGAEVVDAGSGDIDEVLNTRVEMSARDRNALFCSRDHTFWRVPSCL